MEAVVFRKTLRQMRLNSPIVWGAIYIALIPAFAVIYLILPTHSFYHQTAKFEPSTKAAYDDIEQKLAAVFTSTLATGKPVYADWIVDKVNIFNLYQDENAQFNQPTFEVWVNAHRVGTSAATDTLRAGARVMFMRQAWVGLPLRDPNPTTMAHAVDITPFKNWPLPDDVVFPPIPNFDKSIHWLQIPIELDNKINGYESTLRGFPQLSPWDQLLRMTYLSATTVTTLGYGDILPLTTAARLLTALEAIGGLVVIGFFLNSVGQRIAQRR